MGPSGQDGVAAQLTALLRWYEAMGVDAVLAVEPQNRFEAQAVAVPAAAAPTPPSLAPPPVTARPAVAERPPPQAGALAPTPPRQADPALLLPDAAVTAARDAAATAATLDELRDALDRFEGCGLRRMATRLVFADGNPAARIMLVGEAPGAEEDRSGLPFVGRGGQLVDRMLGAIGLDRSLVYIANVVPWRPPGNRDPTPQEVTICLPFIRRQIALCDPDILVLMGKSALQALTASREGITRARGRWQTYDTGTRTIRALPMLHPAYLLRQPAQKKLAWRDLRTLQAALQDGPFTRS